MKVQNAVESIEWGIILYIYIYIYIYIFFFFFFFFFLNFTL